MPPTLFKCRFWTAVFIAAVITTNPASLAARASERLEPASGCYVGVALASGDTPDQFASRVGLRPAVYSKFFVFPINSGTRKKMTGFFSQVRLAGGIAMVTLELPDGLASVTEASCIEFAQLCSEQEAQGIRGLVVRFAHEMNGNWYAWGQQPILYKAKFRLLASQIRARTSRTAMMWAPSYGGGYPFGAPRATPGSPDFAELDTNGDGTLSQKDDMYEPYYPGDDAVDWVGLTLYHWGASWPWLENELPEPNSFADLLTGQYSGLNGNQTAVPDFYARYCAPNSHGKPLAIAETAAFFNPHQGGVPELALKEAWVRQVFNISGDTREAVDVAQHFPNLKCVIWFDHYKLESDQNQWIDWRVSRYPPVRAAFLRAIRTLRDGRPWFLTAQEIDALQQPYSVTDVGLPSVLPITGPVALSLHVQAQAGCDLTAELRDANLQRLAGNRIPIAAGNRLVTVTGTIDQPLVDGAAYYWHISLAPPGSANPALALAKHAGAPQVARAIAPAIQIAAAPPFLVPASTRSIVKVRYAAAEDAVAVVNLLDSQYRWHGGGSVNVSRGAGFLDIPVLLQPNITTGKYLLESFLSNSSTNWHNPMAKAADVPIEVTDTIPRDSIRAIVQSPAIPAGEVFRFIIEYSATAGRDLRVDLFDANTNFLAGASQPVAPGSGIRDMTLSAPLVADGNYFITAFMTPKNQAWDQAIAWSADQPIIVLPPAYQQWLESNWGVLFWMDPIGPADDPDADGADNQAEFMALTNPRDPADLLKASVSKSGSRWTVTWPSSPGRTYQLFQSADLTSGDWTPVGGLIPGTGALIAVDVHPANHAAFFRVQAVPAADPQ